MLRHQKAYMLLHSIMERVWLVNLEGVIFDETQRQLRVT